MPQSNPDNDGSQPDRLGQSNKDASTLDAAALIDRHSRGVWRYLRTLGCDDSTADDLTQETFLRVLRRDNFVQHNDAATAGYLRRTAYNLMVSDLRKQKRVQYTPESSSIDEVWDRWNGKDIQGDLTIDAIKDCISKLTQRAQLALRLRYRKDASRAEIADALQITEHGARNLMQRAKGTLKECVAGKLNLENDE